MIPYSIGYIIPNVYNNIFTLVKLRKKITIIFLPIEFQLFKDPKTWTDAQKHCRTLSAELVTITTTEENSYLKQLIVDKYVKLY